MDKQTIAEIRAVAYSLLAEAFRYPDEAWLDGLKNPRRWEKWPEALGAVYDAAGTPLETLRRRIFGADSARGIQQAAADLFGHALRGRCPAYELEYGQGEIVQKASNLADIAAFYSAFGLEVEENAQERPDHICAECEFMASLCAREAWAIAHGDEMGWSVVRDAQRRFMQDHPAQWLPAFARRVAEADPGGFYGVAAEFLSAYLEEECGALNVRQGPVFLELRPSNEALETSIDCITEEENCKECPLDVLARAQSAAS